MAVLFLQGARAEATVAFYISGQLQFNKLNKQRPCGQIPKTEIWQYSQHAVYVKTLAE